MKLTSSRVSSLPSKHTPEWTMRRLRTAYDLFEWIMLVD